MKKKWWGSRKGEGVKMNKHNNGGKFFNKGDCV